MPNFILCPPPLRQLLEEISDEWDKLMWQSSPEYKRGVSLRLAAHKKAVKEGYASPYWDPDNYDHDWNPIHKIRK